MELLVLPWGHSCFLQRRCEILLRAYAKCEPLLPTLFGVNKLRPRCLWQVSATLRGHKKKLQQIWNQKLEVITRVRWIPRPFSGRVAMFRSAGSAAIKGVVRITQHDPKNDKQKPSDRLLLLTSTALPPAINGELLREWKTGDAQLLIFLICK